MVDSTRRKLLTTGAAATVIAAVPRALTPAYSAACVKAGNGGDSEGGTGEIEAIVDAPESVTSQFDVERFAASR